MGGRIMDRHTRDVRFDNLKGILIFLVVFAHALNKLQDSSMLIAQCVEAVIYSFHMPALVFIAGYFSRDALKSPHYSLHLVKRVLVPFVVAHVLMWIISSRSVYTLFVPEWTLWFLVCLFFWRMLIFPVSRIRCSLAVSIILSLLVGYSPADRLFSLSRMVAFFPFFLAGYKMSESSVDWLRKLNKAIPIAMLALVFSAVVFMRLREIPVLDAFQMTEPYDYYFEDEFYGLLLRFVALLMGFLSIGSLLALMPRKQSLLSSTGKNTITVYLGHSFALLAIRKIITLAAPALLSNEVVVLFCSLILAFLLCLLFASSWVAQLYDMLINWLSRFVFIRSKSTGNHHE